MDDRQDHGDTNVPPNHPVDPQFERWVASQRMRLREGPLDHVEQERRARLDAIGYEWRRVNGLMNGGRNRVERERRVRLNAVYLEWRRAYEWDNMFQQLAALQQEHGHSNVPRRVTDNPRLVAWVASQRAGLNGGQN